MGLRSVEELMDLLHAARGAGNGAGNSPALPGGPGDPHDHALQTAALLRRGHPSDKELQVAGLVHEIGPLLAPGERAGHAERAADAVRPLLGERVAGLVRLHASGRPDGPLTDDALILRQACEAGRAAALYAGVMEDWRTLLELIVSHNSRLGAVD